MNDPETGSFDVMEHARACVLFSDVKPESKRKTAIAIYMADRIKRI